MPFITRTHSRVALVAIAVLAVVGVSSGIAQNSLSDQATAAGSNLICDQNTLYGITSSKEVIQIDATTGATTPVTTLPTAMNALAITKNGTSAWAFESGGSNIDKYDPIAGTSSSIATSGGTQTVIRGAVNPVTNIYYYAGGGTSARLAAYNIGTGTDIGQVGTITGLGGNNGDMAFGTDGTLYIVDGIKVYQLSNVPTTAGTPNLAATEILTLPNGTNSPGIAYSSDGFLYLARGSNAQIYKVNPSSGASSTTVTISSGQDVVDLATCNYSNSLRGQVDVRNRAASGDQFTVTTSGNGISTSNTGTTTGSTTGVQPQIAGPNLTVGGASYTATLTASGTTTLSNYSVGWTCVNRSMSNQVVASGSGTTATFTNPMATTADGTDVVCTFITALRPVANNDSYSTPINTTLTVNAASGVIANDTGTNITLASATSPSHGTASANGTGGAFSYTPTTGFTGTDTFDYTITDVNGTTATATATIQVNPVATNDSYSTPADTARTISNLTANDNPTTMTVQSVTTPSHGTAVLNSDGTVTYTPTTGYVGPDSFSYTAIDANGRTATATVAMTVAATAADDTATGTPDSPTMVRPLTNDTPSAGASFDPATLRILDPASVTWVTEVTEAGVGTWKVVGSELKFTPVSGYSGNSSIDYHVTDTASNTVTAKASVFYPPTLALRLHERRPRRTRRLGSGRGSTPPRPHPAGLLEVPALSPPEAAPEAQRSDGVITEKSPGITPGLFCCFST